SVCLAGFAVCMTTLSQMRARLARAFGTNAPSAQSAGEDGLWRGGFAALVCLAYAALQEPMHRLAVVSAAEPALLLAEGAAMPQGLAALSAAEAAAQLMMIPCIVWMAIALVRALRYPMDARYERKLRRYETLAAQGIEEEGLREELERTLERPYSYRWGVRLLAIALRTAMPHRLVGAEHLKQAEAGDAVLLCNHGEWYGPIASYLYVPFPIRPWSDERVTNKARSVDHINRYTLSKQAWLPETWRLPLARDVLAPLLHWLMTSVNGIPVYRDHPAALVKTFRASVAALRAGDTLLIFPENPDDPSFEKAGYVRQGVGPWFSGIGALGHLHYRQTGNPLLFVPMYASKRSRTLSVGEPEVYDGTADPQAEGERLIQILHARTIELACAAGDILPPMAGNSSVAT
ncbi:MAG TPA: 1-acyl-sn-glycerol-3-phosphate acyltransferase, partial [Clostridia bacterium]|nr:1-acyl-sn-glycerol-3-phosphate acyltransferase [Clostridia bacterium]